MLLRKQIEDGGVAPLIAKTIALEQLADAQTEFEKKRHVGKLVIDMRVG